MILMKLCITTTLTSLIYLTSMPLNVHTRLLYDLIHRGLMTTQN